MELAYSHNVTPMTDLLLSSILLTFKVIMSVLILYLNYIISDISKDYHTFGTEFPQAPIQSLTNNFTIQYILYFYLETLTTTLLVLTPQTLFFRKHTQ